MPLALRSLRELLALAGRATGDLRVREHDGLVHRVTVRRGQVVAVRVGGSFDPILARLREAGLLSETEWIATVEALARSERRAGALAMEVAGVDGEALRSALGAQLRDRLRRVVGRARAHGHDAWLEPREVAPSEQAAALPIAELLADSSLWAVPRPPPAPAPDPLPPSRLARDRRALRKLAFALHPDRNHHLSADARASLEAELMRATAAFHGLS